MGKDAWMLVGDFNVIFSMAERSDYFQGMMVDKKGQEFQSCIEEIGVTDIASEGLFYTHGVTTEQRHMAKKLDRILVNDRWLQDFTEMGASFLLPDFSDPGLIYCKNPSKA